MDADREELHRLVRDCMKPNDTITLYWFDILAIMIVGYWIGNVIVDWFWWF